MTKAFTRSFLFFGLAAVVCSHGSPPISRHYRLLQEASEDMPKVVVVADGGQTSGGPFAFSRDLYTPGGDLLATANGRTTVTDGIPLTLNFVIYAVNETEAIEPLENAEVFVWQADAFGVYSYVMSMDTENETWLRARATTDTEGKATFSTILPGWYPGRAIHWHFRVRLSGEEDFYVTSQLFVPDGFLQSYSEFGLYAQNPSRLLTFNLDDFLFRNIADDVADELILDFEGSNEIGYSATFRVGIDANDAGVTTTDSSVPPSQDSDVNQTIIDGDGEAGDPGTQLDVESGHDSVPLHFTSLFLLLSLVGVVTDI